MTQNQFNYSLTEGRKNRHAFFFSLLFILQVLNKTSFEFFLLHLFSSLRALSRLPLQKMAVP